MGSRVPSGDGGHMCLYVCVDGLGGSFVRQRCVARQLIKTPCGRTRCRTYVACVYVRLLNRGGQFGKPMPQQ